MTGAASIGYGLLRSDVAALRIWSDVAALRIWADVVASVILTLNCPAALPSSTRLGSRRRFAWSRSPESSEKPLKNSGVLEEDAGRVPILLDIHNMLEGHFVSLLACSRGGRSLRGGSLI
jgi:hypothetical protein